MEKTSTSNERLEAIRRRVRTERRKRGLTQRQLADASGLTQSAISQLESGPRVPNVMSLDRVAEGLGMSLAELLQAANDA